MKRIIFLSLITLMGCAHSIHQSNTSDFKDMKPSAPTVEVNTEQFVVLGFANETNYVDQAFNDLQTKCNGRVTGITTKFSTDLGFLSWTNRIKMTGYCIQN